MRRIDSGYILRSALDMERNVLGALLIEPSVYVEIEGFLSDLDFYDEKNRIIFGVIESLHKEHEAVDMSIVAERLRAKGELEKAGGALYISSLTNNIASAIHIQHHARIIKQKSTERQNIEISMQAIRKIEDNEDVDDVMTWQYKQIELLQTGMTGNRAAQRILDPMKEEITDMYARRDSRKQGRSLGITTGLFNLDHIMGGWQKSDLIVIAARPAMGKTAFALHFAQSAAKAGHPVVIFSLEMSKRSLAGRLLISESGVNAYNYRTGRIDDEDAAEVEKALGAYHDLPIYVDDNASVSMSHIHSTLRQMNRQGECELAIIDYLQLISGSKTKNTYREQEISQMSREAKKIAKELNIPVILLSQLNRESEKRNDRRPALSDLRESGAIEQDADIVCLLHRPEYYRGNLEVDNVIVDRGIEFIVAKYRNGATGSVILQHDGTLNRIYDYNRRSAHNTDPDKFHEPGTGDEMPF
jgi:replicative DNA helicase